jgi:asparagine N-glycosylation enzyme membrane subunit Stt3
MPKMTKGSLSVVLFAASAAIGSGFGFIAGGLSNRYVGLGVGILAFCAAFALLAETKSFTETWEQADDE